MATVAHHIISNYGPEDRERIEGESGQHDAEADIADPWMTEKAFGKSKRTGNAPRFIRATVQYDPWMEDSPVAGPSRTAGRSMGTEESEESVAGWYRSLTRKAPSSAPAISGVSSRTDIPTPPSTTHAVSQTKRRDVKQDRNDWFISRVLQSQPHSTENPQGAAPTMTSTLADILSRDPPPLPTEKPFTPPVWIAIGPGNKGFEMLTKSGWEEGEALGKQASRRNGLGYKGKPASTLQKKKDAEIVDVDAPEIVDLTLSEDEDEDNVFIKSASPPIHETHESVLEGFFDSDMDHNPRALLTPLPTVLKSDKLGIGLKAKIVGPYRESRKRVTHSQAALAAHIRQGEELKKLKKLVGRGRRGHDRMKRRDEEKRKNFLAYMNAD